MDAITFRPIEPTDMDPIKALHEEFFPVKYSQDFYDNTCNGIGINGGRLFSSLAINRSGEIIGFALAQMFEYPKRCEDKDLFAFDCKATKVCYIITVGVVERIRKTGLGTTLIEHCVEYAKTDKECGAVSGRHCAISKW
jgi:ribosomal protein S18 acetylase RimI-like enzyme